MHACLCLSFLGSPTTLSRFRPSVFIFLLTCLPMLVVDVQPTHPVFARRNFAREFPISLLIGPN